MLVAVRFSRALKMADSSISARKFVSNIAFFFSLWRQHCGARAFPYVAPFCHARKICCGHKFCVLDTKKRRAQQCCHVLPGLATSKDTNVSSFCQGLNNRTLIHKSCSGHSPTFSLCAFYQYCQWNSKKITCNWLLVFLV